MIPFPFQAGGFGSSLPVSSGDTDPYFSNVSLLLHMDGTNGSTTFTDNSPSPKTPTVNGNTQISTAQSQFGSASGYFDGSGDYLTYADSADFAFGSGDFTVECFVRIATTSGQLSIFGKRSVYSPLVMAVNDNRIYVLGSYAGGGWDFNPTFTSGSINVGLNTWTHLAAVRDGTTLRTFVGGVADYTFSLGTNSLFSNSELVSIGANSSSGSGPFNGYIDELRITKGVARYTANFTPPVAPFPNS